MILLCKMKEARKIKGLKSQLSKLRGDSESLKIELANTQREYHAKLKKIEQLQLDINRFEKNGKIKVSEHAIVRYFERVKGLDIELVEKEILSKDVMKLIDQLGGNGTYPNKDFKIILKNNTVTTIV